MKRNINVMVSLFSSMSMTVFSAINPSEQKHRALLLYPLSEDGQFLSEQCVKSIIKTKPSLKENLKEGNNDFKNPEGQNGDVNSVNTKSSSIPAPNEMDNVNKQTVVSESSKNLIKENEQNSAAIQSPPENTASQPNNMPKDPLNEWLKQTDPIIYAYATISFISWMYNYFYNNQEHLIRQKILSEAISESEHKELTKKIEGWLVWAQENYGALVGTTAVLDFSLKCFNLREKGGMFFIPAYLLRASGIWSSCSAARSVWNKEYSIDSLSFLATLTQFKFQEIDSWVKSGDDILKDSIYFGSMAVSFYNALKLFADKKFEAKLFDIPLISTSLPPLIAGYNTAHLIKERFFENQETTYSNSLSYGAGAALGGLVYLIQSKAPFCHSQNSYMKIVCAFLPLATMTMVDAVVAKGYDLYLLQNKVYTPKMDDEEPTETREICRDEL